MQFNVKQFLIVVIKMVEILITVLTKLLMQYKPLVRLLNCKYSVVFRFMTITIV